MTIVKGSKKLATKTKKKDVNYKNTNKRKTEKKSKGLGKTLGKLLDEVEKLRYDEENVPSNQLYGFVWSNQSCAFDSLFTIYWMLYIHNVSCFNDLIMGKLFRWVRKTNQEIDLKMIKPLLFTIYVPKRAHGKFTSYPKITDEIYKVDKISTTMSDIVTHEKICGVCNKKTYYYGFYVDDTDSSLQSKLDIEIKKKNKCVTCSKETKFSHLVVSPIILSVFIYGCVKIDESMSTVIFNKKDYRLFGYVNYNENHFTSIICFDNFKTQFQYDGMRNDGLVEKADSERVIESACVLIYTLEH